MSIDRWGLQSSFMDVHKVRHEITPKTRRAILESMDATGDRADAALRSAKKAVWVIEQGQRLPIEARAELLLEDGGTLFVGGTLPRDLPLGYHRLHRSHRAPETTLIVTPSRCYLPKSLRAWGWAIQLYATRSSKSWGIGDLADLRRLGEWSARELGAEMLLLNPLRASAPVLPQEPSPYFPTTRRFWNILYLKIEEVPGAKQPSAELRQLAAAGQALNKKRQIDYDRVFQLKMRALAILWTRFREEPNFERYRRSQGEGLTKFATFCALAERHGRNWRRWPSGYHEPDSSQVKKFQKEEADRVRFHEWLQWLIDEQVRRAGGEMGLMHDLPIGFDPGGADAWVWQDLLAKDATVGAPPDEFSADGQNWGLPPFVPYKLRAAAYEPFIETVRATLRHGRGLRIDHVMGLFRLFWIPEGMTAKQGAYVNYAVEDLLGILALESQRARAVIVGEDLGTVEESMRKQLARHRILSYRLLWFEKVPPSQFPELALAAVTNHDLPTVKGLWTGSDLKEQRRLALKPNEAGLQEMYDRLGTMTRLKKKAPAAEVVERTYRLLGTAPSRLLMATLDDALTVEERPNLPGTITERPNWALALPLTLECLETIPLPRKIASALRRPAPSRRVTPAKRPSRPRKAR
ncbi:MAG TPA: 4-alpha-glucanotransferase [Nitrospirales bacterium]